MQTATITIPLIPPSVNSYVRHTRGGAHYVTKAAIAFRDALYALSRGVSAQALYYEVSITVFLGKDGRGDLDNFAKVPIDALIFAKVIKNDAFIVDLHLIKRRDWSSPRTEITVRGVDSRIIRGKA